MAEYVGLTQTTLSRRLTCHRQNGGIYDHFLKYHGDRPTRGQLVENTTVLVKATDKQRLVISEALLISEHKPEINKQYESFPQVLKLFSPRNERLNKSQTGRETNYPVQQCPSDSSPVDSGVPLQASIEQAVSVWSQRTHKLLASPIKIHKITNPINGSDIQNLVDDQHLTQSQIPVDIPPTLDIDKNMTHNDGDEVESTEEIPDMHAVLSRFGIKFSGAHSDQLIGSDSPTHNTDPIPQSPAIDLALPDSSELTNSKLKSQTNETDTSPYLSIGSRIRSLRRKYTYHTHLK